MPNRDIGIDVRPPSREPAAGDRLNPFNGSLSVRGSLIVGTVVSNRMQATCIVEKQRQTLVPKFERYEKRTRRYPAHVPSNIDVHVGDEVVIAECRPISKTVTFVVVENRGNPSDQRGAVREARDARVEAAHTRTTERKPAKVAKPKAEPKAAPKGEKTEAKAAKPKADTKAAKPKGGA